MPYIQLAQLSDFSRVILMPEDLKSTSKNFGLDVIERLRLEKYKFFMT